VTDAEIPVAASVTNCYLVRKGLGAERWIVTRMGSTTDQPRSPGRKGGILARSHYSYEKRRKELLKKKKKEEKRQRKLESKAAAVAESTPPEDTEQLEAEDSPAPGADDPSETRAEGGSEQ